MLKDSIIINEHTPSLSRQNKKACILRDDKVNDFITLLNRLENVNIQLINIFNRTNFSPTVSLDYNQLTIEYVA